MQSAVFPGGTQNVHTPTFVARVESKSNRENDALLLLDREARLAGMLVRAGPNERLSTFDVSHDGQWVAYTCEIRSEDQSYPNPEIRIVSIDGRHNQLLLPQRPFDSFCYSDPIFSPTTLRLACQIAYRPMDNPDLVVLDVLSLDDTLVETQRYWLQNQLHIGLHSPAFMREGNSIAYYYNAAYEDALEVCVSDLESDGFIQNKQGRILTSNADGVWHRTRAIAVQPQWQQIFFIRGHMGEYESISVVRPADIPGPMYLKQFTALSGQFRRIGGLQITSDGLWLVFDADGKIFSLSTDGSKLKTLSPQGLDHCQEPAISKDGKYIAFLEEGTVYTCTIEGENLKIHPTPDWTIKKLAWI
jgi:Tol biopolymer transport system component